MSDSKAGTSSREELAMILDNVADGVLATDVEGRVIFANRAAAQMLGKESGPPLEGTLASEACLPFLDELGQPVVPDELPQQRAVRGERSKETLLGCRREGEGQTRWLLVKSDPITGPDGSVRSVVTIFRDVTTSRAAEDALRAANEALRAVVRSSPLPIIVLDTDLTIRLWNPAAEKTFGWSEEEVLGKRSPLITSELEAESALFAAQLASGAEVPPLETKRLTRHGNVLDVTVWATSFTSPEGRRQLLGIVADSTEARRATAERERLLRQIETERNFLRVILDQLPVGARVANAAGEIIFANQELLRIWGDGDEGHWTGFHPDGRPYDRTDWPIFRAVREQREIVNEEIEIVRADRSGGTLLASSAPVRDADGEIVGGVSVLADITERKRAEMGARFLAQASHILTSSLDHRVTLREVARLAVPWLADWCSVHLRKRDGSIGSVAIEHGDPERRDWAETSAPEYRPDPGAARGIGAVIRTGRSEIYDAVSDEMLRDAAKDEASYGLLRGLGMRSAMLVPIVGRQRTLGAIAFLSTQEGRRFDAADRALAEELGRRAGLAVENAILFRRESDARREAERAAKRTATLQHFAEALSEAATEAAIADLIVTTGLHDLGAVAGSLALIRGDEIVIVRSEGYRQQVLERWQSFPLTAQLPLADAIREGRIVTYASLEELFDKYPHLRVIPDWKHRSFAAVPLLVGSRAVGAIGLSFESESTFDREEIDLMLAVARQCAQALERARLLEAERAARAEAEAANRAKDEFLATLSHELRTPMTATLGWSRMLTMLNVDEETLRLAIDSIHRSTQAQARIVDDLLDVARIVTGKMKLEPRPMLLRPLIVDALESVRAAADARSITIDLELADPPLPVVGDPDRLRQVVWNLLSNAIKFTHQGGHVRIHLEREGDQARLVIADDGQGIRPELLPLIFERFRQGDSSASRSVAGLGLGLSIVKHLVELHGGKVQAQSEGEGKGATFTISIPLAPRDAIEPLNSTLDPRHSLAGRSLVVVDDEQDTCLMIAAMLRQYGAEVRTASNAADAIMLLRASRPHVLVSDLAMPEVDGFALATRIRMEGDAELPILALTAYGRPEDRERALKAGFTSYLRKPVDPDALVESIRQLLQPE